MNASRYVGLDKQNTGQLVRYKGRYVCTINQADHFKATKPGDHFSREDACIRECLGLLMLCDMGKQVWATMSDAGDREVYHVESAEQRDKRLAALSDGGRDLSLDKQRRDMEQRHAQEIIDLMRH